MQIALALHVLNLFGGPSSIANVVDKAEAGTTLAPPRIAVHDSHSMRRMRFIAADWAGEACSGGHNKLRNCILKDSTVLPLFLSPLEIVNADSSLY
jgi:hypothetical protein